MKLYSYPEAWTLLNNSGTALDLIAFEKFASLRIRDQEIYDGLIATESHDKAPANVLNLPLEQRAEMALKAAVERVLVEELGKVAHLHPARSRQLHWDVMWEFIVGMMEP